jgi:hypothetical protein
LQRKPKLCPVAADGAINIFVRAGFSLSWTHKPLARRFRCPAVRVGGRGAGHLVCIYALVLTTPLSRIPQRRNRVMIAVLMAVIVFSSGGTYR